MSVTLDKPARRGRGARNTIFVPMTGVVEVTERALNYTRDLLNVYEEPKLDAGINEALLDYIARREREIPVADALNQDL